MKAWEQVRNSLLTAILIGCGAVLTKVLMFPAQKPALPTYTFPESVQLPRWQFVESIPIAQQKPALATSVDDLAIASRHYRYERDGTTIDIEMRYFVETYTDVPELLKDSTVFARKPDLTLARSSLGAYAVFGRSNKLHLSACIPPTLETTVTNGELRSSQNRPEVLVHRVAPWFLGQAPLRDLRCLWTTLSVSIDNKPEAEVQQTLEQAWPEWVGWWQQHYPPQP